MALYLQDTVQKGEAARYSRLEEMVHRHVEQKIRDNNFNIRTEEMSLHGTAAWKEDEKENSQGNAQETIKDRKHGDCFKHDVNKKEGKEEDSVFSPKREDTRKVTEKEIPKGKDPKVPVRLESQINKSVLISRRRDAKRNPLAIIGTHQNGHTTKK